MNHLRAWRARWGGKDLPCVLDYGCGVTFLPFTLAEMECRVVCSDSSAAVEKTLSTLISVAPSHQGSVSFVRACDLGEKLKERKADACVCVSVLEHTEQPELVIEGIARSLAPGGILVLTFDLDMQGNLALSPGKYRDVREATHDYFDLLLPELTVHPLDVLRPHNSPNQPECIRGTERVVFEIRQLGKRLLGRRVWERPFDLGIVGLVLQRRR